MSYMTVLYNYCYYFKRYENILKESNDLLHYTHAVVNLIIVLSNVIFYFCLLWV